MKTLTFLIYRFYLLVALLTVVLVGCSNDDSPSDDSQMSVEAPQSIVGESLIWKHNGYNDDTYTLNPIGTVTVKSTVNDGLNAVISNSSYLYTPQGDGNATLRIKYTSTFYSGSIKSVITYDIEFVMTFYKVDSGVYSAYETTNVLGKKEKTGPFLLGKVGDVIVDDDSPINGAKNCEQRQFIYDSMSKNLASMERLRDDDKTSSGARIAAIAQISRIKQDMTKAKADAKKVGCTLN